MKKMTLEQFKEQFNIKLNNQQLKAVQSVQNPTLLLAVPGSGKTTVLVTRLGYMIYCLGIEPESILTVTYTVAATNYMRQRFETMFGEQLAARLEFRTINGICSKIINYYGNCIGRKAFDLITEEGFKSKILSLIYQKELNEYPSENDLQTVITLITYIKNMMLSNEEIESLGKKENLPLAEIYKAYCGELRKQSLMDYDDQMVYAYTMLKTTPQVLEYFQNMYQYICVDEAQDTSKIQHKIIGILAMKNKKLFMVGDEDQSIYGFRAAYPEALLSFESTYPEGKILLMEENFRSDGAIVSAADRFIQKNKLRHKKNMKASRDMVKDIRLIEVKTRKSQYSYLTKVAENCNVDTAVLYRDNESIIPVVDMLERSGIDYKIKNADLTFFNHKIVTDIKNIIRFAENPKDTEIFMQIYFKIGTYLSKMGAIEACRISEEKGIPVIDSALRYGRIPKGTEKSLKAMKTHIESILEESAYKAVYRIVNFMGYSAYLERAKIKDGKISILQALAANEKTPEDFLNRLDELAMIIKNKKNNYDCKFTLSTIHSSKGLEYDTVYIMDVKDGVFPEKVVANRKKATDEEIKTYEEERRLYYVAVTRAKNQLCIFDFKDSSTFNNQLLGINVKSSADKTKFQKSGKKGIIATDRKTSKAIEMLRSKSYLR